MLIGELAAKSGLSRDTIRFYEKQGLIAVGRKERRDNNYKEYSEAVLETLLTIKRIKNYGFTLNEAAELMAMMVKNEATCHNVGDLIESKVAVLNAKIMDMLALRDQLITSAQQCKDNCNVAQSDSNCPILVTDRLA